MNIYIENEIKAKFDFRGYRKLTGLVIETVAARKHIPENLDVNVMLVSEERIRTINKETRGIDKVTDVLSFPYFDFEIPGVFDAPEELTENEDGEDHCVNTDIFSDKDLDEPDEVYGSDEFSEPEEYELILGDIVICAQKVKEQAESFGHSQKRELAFLIVHSMLHLIGYDHIEEQDERIMSAEAEKIMDALKIYR